MHPGAYAVGVVPMAAIDPADLLSVAGALETLLADDENDLRFLAETSPGTEGDPDGEMLRLSDRGFTTGDGESPEHTSWDARLETPLNYESRIPLPDGEDSTGSIGFGDVEIRNEDGALNSLLSKSFEGRQFDVKVGGTLGRGRANERTLLYAEYGLALRATVDGVSSESGRIHIRLREGLGKLDRPLQSTRYSGAGLGEGPAELTGVQKPLTFGRRRNRKAFLVDPTFLVYQVHERSVHAIDAVKIRGVPVGTFDRDVASYIGLITISVAPGHWVSCLSLGLFRLGATPDGEVTADVRGDNVGGYVDTTPGIAKRIATWKGEVVDPTELDGGTFANYEPLREVGFHSDDEETVADALERLLHGDRGWHRVTRLARLAIGRFAAPEDQDPVATFTDAQISSLSEGTELAPVWSVKVGYDETCLVQDADSLASSVSAADRLRLSTQYRYAIAEDASIKTLHPDARAITHDSLYVDQADAQDLADETLAMLGKRRRRYSLTRERTVLQRAPGEVIEVVSGDSDLSGGRNLLAVGVAEVGHQRTNDFELWG